MVERKEHNNPKRIFREQDDRVAPDRPPAIEPQTIASVRRSELASIAPDDINWGNIFCGKQHGLESVKPEMESRKRETI
ncbi:MAG: hypothetical protein Kow0099_10380 [Candidatus Abyssubacteria bacterium]